MSDSEGSTPYQHHLRFLAAAVNGDEARLEGIFSEQPHWSSASGRAVLRQALQKAAGKGRLRIVCLLLDWGAEIEPQQENEVSPLFKAVESRDPSTAMKLLERGANPDWRRPKDGQTALFIACLHGSYHIVDSLLKAGVDPNTCDREGRTPLLFVATEWKSSRWDRATLMLLLEKGAEIEARDPLGRTALLWAATSGNTPLVEALLDGCANVSVCNNRGTTALHFAAEKNYEDMVKILLSKGAYAQAMSDGGWTALHIAAQNGHAVITALLLEAGTAVNSQLQNGMTPLHWAAFNGHEDVVRRLLASPGVNSDIKDAFHRTPMLCAVERGYKEIALLLSPHRAGERLSPEAQAACRGFEATIVDFGQFAKRQLVSKESVYDLLYGWDYSTNQPKRQVLPKNTLLAKSFAEGGYQSRDIESFKALEECFDQEQHGSSAHDHSMRPFCQRIAPQQPDPVEQSSNPTYAPDRTETDHGDPRGTTASMSEPVGFAQSLDRGEPRSRRSRHKAEILSERHPGKRPKLSTPPRKVRGEDVGETAKVANPGNIVLFVPFLHYETAERREKMDNAIKNMRTGEQSSGNPSADLQLVKGYLNHQRPLHIRRTLDQYFYSGIDTTVRNKDQVVSRYCKRNRWEDKMLMVDQLWLWIIGKDLVITCFASRWEQPKNDPLNVLDNIIEETNGIKTRAPVTSAYHLATLVFNSCCNTFGRPRVDKSYQFPDMFESSTGLIINRQTQLLRSFNQVSALSTRWLKERQKRQGHSGRTSSFPGEHDFVLDALLELGEESAMLNETNDIRDELNIIVMILDSQTAMLGTFESVITEELREGGGNRSAIDDLVGQLRKRCREQQRRIETRYRDLQRIDRRAENAYTSLRSLLELKQMQSNALEAKFARDQAVTASKQGQAILVFTVVTIVFVPMSFIATLFTINIDVWGDPLTLPYVAKYTFGIGLSISIPLIVMALTVTDIANAVKWFLIEAKNRLLHGWASPADDGPKYEVEEFVMFPSKGDEPAPGPEKRWRPPSPYPQGGPESNTSSEEATEGMLTPLDRSSKPQGRTRTQAYPISWARRTMHRKRARGNDDPESGSIS
ncbi:hypothetical protein Hte_001558 [Hypoxylon texense]